MSGITCAPLNFHVRPADGASGSFRALDSFHLPNMFSYGTELARNPAPNRGVAGGIKKRRIPFVVSWISSFRMAAPNKSASGSLPTGSLLKLVEADVQVSNIRAPCLTSVCLGENYEKTPSYSTALRRSLVIV